MKDCSSYAGRLTYPKVRRALVENPALGRRRKSDPARRGWTFPSKQAIERQMRKYGMVRILLPMNEAVEPVSIEERVVCVAIDDHNTTWLDLSTTAPYLVAQAEVDDDPYSGWKRGVRYLR